VGGLSSCPPEQDAEKSGFVIASRLSAARNDTDDMFPQIVKG
jgi:hypothetical protein